MCKYLHIKSSQKMIETIRKNWLPILGGGSSVSFKGIQDLTSNPDVIETAKTATETIASVPEHGVFWYLLIGAAGAAGGLLIKIFWGCAKAFFPVLKKIDPDPKK